MLRRLFDIRAAWGSWLVGALLLSVLVGVRIWNPVGLHIFQLRGFDVLQRLSPAQAPQQEAVVILDVDERSLARLGQWPWPRSVIAAIVDRAMEAGALVVGFDVLLAERDRTSPAMIAERFAEVVPELAARLRLLPDDDQVLADAIKRGRVVVGQSGVPFALPDDGRRTIAPSIAILGIEPHSFLFDVPGIIRNLPVLESAAIGHGMFSLEPEVDGVVRRVPAMIRHGKDIYPTLALEMLRVALGVPTFGIRSSQIGVEEIILGPFAIATDARGRIWPHAGSQRIDRYIPVIDLIEGRVDPQKLHGRLALVGTSAIGLLDIKTTPIERALPGVEVHAAVLDGILHQDLLWRAFDADLFETMVVAALGVILILIMPAVGARYGAMILITVLLLVCVGTWWAFMKHKTVLDAVYPVLALGLLGTVLGYLSYRHEEQLRQSIHGNFSRFVAPTLVERMVRGGIAVALGGERKELSVLFVDMRGYTRLSETMDAQDLIQFTNRYLQPTSDAVQRDHGGTIDKYIGDSVMAFWNAPLDDPDHPRHACLAILAIRRGIAELNRQLTAEGLPYAPIRIGIGVSTGECSVGNVGSRQKLEYTALGDTVNLASRLEGLTKEFGVDNLVDTATIQRAGDLAYLPLGELDIRGRGRAVSAATLVGDERTAGDPAFLAFAAKHHAWMNAHHNNDSEAATRLFAELKQEAANFGVERVYAAISSRSPG